MQESRTDWRVAGALGAALAASACCTVPLLLVTLGVGGAWVSSLTALAPYRPFFVALAVGLLGLAFYRSYRAARQPACACDEATPSRLKHGLMMAGALAVLALIVSPWLLAAPDAKPQGVVAAAEARQVMLDVRGMTCAGCVATVRQALKQRDGVLDAHVTYEPARAVVRYDPARVTMAELLTATASAGYPSSPAENNTRP